MNKTYVTDIIIVGAGIAGLTLACLLEKHTAYRVIIVERGDAPRQRMSAVNSVSVKLWQHLGVWDAKLLSASPYRHMQVWDHCGGMLHFDAPDEVKNVLGFIVPDHCLHEALLAKVKNSTQVRLLNQQICLDILQQEDSIRLETQEAIISAKYLIGCDGAYSWVREKMQFALTSWEYDHSAIVAQVVTEKSHQHTAYQKFTAEGPCAFLPLCDQHHSSIVWSVSPAHAEKLMTLSDDAFLKELNFISDMVLGRVTKISERFVFPLVMRHVKKYVNNRVILCADAAHTVHPMAGQGLNLAMQDVMALANAFIETKQENHVHRLLRQYERARKAENWQMILGLEAIKRLYSVTIPEVQLLVQLGVQSLDRANVLKKFMLKVASGQHVSLPVWLNENS